MGAQGWWGSAGFTTDSSGNHTITHGAPFTPTAVFVQEISGTGYVSTHVTAIAATTFTVRCFDAAGVGLNAVPVTIYYDCKS